uniref:Uncharacterized protein n=1 Tax=Rhizophora mucronata TaxID=61149 RepID=A0A2P2PAY5_RHIMU
MSLFILVNQHAIHRYGLTMSDNEQSCHLCNVQLFFSYNCPILLAAILELYAYDYSPRQ